MSYEALRGITVLDLGIITAGASTSTILSDLGADVIKVEGPDYIDPFRFWTDAPGGERWWDRSAPFAFTNRGKRSLCVDLKADEGRALFLDLVRTSDVVVENFRVGVLERLGISYEVLQATNAAIVLISVSSQGQTGPDARAVSFGSTLEGSSGMASLIRFPGGAPQVSGHALNYPDQVVSLFAAGAVMCGLSERETSGRGAHIDLSQRELASFMLGEHLIAALAPGADRVDAQPDLAIIAVALDGRRVALSFDTPEEAARFADALGEEDGRPASAVIEAWIAGVRAAEAVARIRAGGGRAECVRTAADLLSPGGQGYDSYARVRDATGNSAKGLPWQTGDTPLPPPAPIPPLGSDNEAIVMGRLGRSRREYDDLVGRGILAAHPRAASKT